MNADPPLLVRGFSLFSTGLEEGRKNTLCKGSAFLGRAFCVYDFFKIGALSACLFKAGFAPSPLGKVRAGLPRRKFAVKFTEQKGRHAECLPFFCFTKVAEPHSSGGEKSPFCALFAAVALAVQSTVRTVAATGGFSFFLLVIKINGD